MATNSAIPEDRPLTSTEAELVGWLLQHGVSEALGFLTQLDRARVTSRCGCGCRSIDFAIDGVVPSAGGAMNVLADFHWQAAGGELFGIFVFARYGLLAGLEVYSIDGLADAKSLPDVEQLR